MQNGVKCYMEIYYAEDKEKNNFNLGDGSMYHICDDRNASGTLR